MDTTGTTLALSDDDGEGEMDDELYYYDDDDEDGDGDDDSDGDNNNNSCENDPTDGDSLVMVKVVKTVIVMMTVHDDLGTNSDDNDDGNIEYD